MLCLIKREPLGSLPGRTMILTLLALGLFLSAGSAPELWVFDRVAISQGEWWRLITGHWVHSDAQHALWNILALAVLGICFERELKHHLWWILFIAMAGVDIWLWWGRPDLYYYCGLSGILNTLLVVGLGVLWQSRRDPLLLIIIGLAGLKIGWELMAGQALFTDTVWPSVPDVHAVGFVVGLPVLLFAATRSPSLVISFIIRYIFKKMRYQVRKMSTHIGKRSQSVV